MIGHLVGEPSARTFSDYLYVQGIKNQIESDKDGTWAVWIHGEDEIEQARQIFHRYQSRPDDPEFQKASKQAREIADREKEQDEAAAKRIFERGQIFHKYGPHWIGPLTLVLMAVSIGVWLVMVFGGQNRALVSFVNALFISEELLGRSLSEVRHGQVWRLFTPIFMHSDAMPLGILHLLFNMYWLKDLGSMVEARQGSLRLALMVLIISASSNLAEYFVTGPGFLGMSGVVYGLFGYIWMKGKFDPPSGYFIEPSAVTSMLVWFAFCLTGWFLPVANTIHAVGLGLGVAWGYLSAIGLFSIRR